MNYRLLGSALLLASTIGCATPMSAMRADNRRLSDAVAELRADRHTQDRKLTDMQHELDLARAKQVGTVNPTMVAPTDLRVEVAAPPPNATTGYVTSGDQRVVGVADDGTEIVYEGDAAAGRQAQLDGDAINTASDAEPVAVTTPPRKRDRAPVVGPVPTTTDRLEVTTPVHARTTHAIARTRATSSDAPGERTAPAGDPAADYRAAVELVKTGPFDDAVAALHAFIQKYPRHDYADNAQYWLGEAYYAHKDFAQALVEFRAVIEVYPRGNKVPDALLKVGYCYGAMGQADKSHAVLEQVVNLYPKSEPAALAQKKLAEGAK